MFLYFECVRAQKMPERETIGSGSSPTVPTYVLKVKTYVNR